MGRPKLPMTPEREAMLKAKSAARKLAWSLAARAKRRERLAAKAIAEGREPYRPGGVVRFTAQEIREHQKERAARRDPGKKRASARASMARLYKLDPQRFVNRARERELWLKENAPLVFKLSRAARCAAYRARREGTLSERGLTAIVRRAWEASGGKCAACADTDRLELDHKLALINGGTNDEGNLQFLCKPCNSSKNDRDWAEWLASRSPLELAA